VKLVLLLLAQLDDAGDKTGMIAAIAHYFGIPLPNNVRDMRDKGDAWSLLVISYGNNCYYFYANGSSSVIDFKAPLDNIGTIF
jgi:hypothetical protein